MPDDFPAHCPACCETCISYIERTQAPPDLHTCHLKDRL